MERLRSTLPRRLGRPARVISVFQFGNLNCYSSTSGSPLLNVVGEEQVQELKRSAGVQGSSSSGGGGGGGSSSSSSSSSTAAAAGFASYHDAPLVKILSV